MKNIKNPQPEQSNKAQQESEIRLLEELLDRISTHAEELEKELIRAKQKIATLRLQAPEHWEHKANQLQITLDALYASRSWKLTLPVRIMSRLLRWISGLPSRAYRRLSQQVRSFGTDKGQDTGPGPGRKKHAGYRGQARNRAGSTELSPRETEIYNELHEIIDRKKNEN